MRSKEGGYIVYREGGLPKDIKLQEEGQVYGMGMKEKEIHKLIIDF